MESVKMQSGNGSVPINPMDTLPLFETKSFYRWVAKAVEKYFEDPTIQRRFEIWKAEQDKEKNNAEEGGEQHG